MESLVLKRGAPSPPRKGRRGCEGEEENSWEPAPLTSSPGVLHSVLWSIHVGPQESDRETGPGSKGWTWGGVQTGFQVLSKALSSLTPVPTSFLQPCLGVGTVTGQVGVTYRRASGDSSGVGQPKGIWAHPGKGACLQDLTKHEAFDSCGWEAFEGSLFNNVEEQEAEGRGAGFPRERPPFCPIQL
ncbi:hypothetical protein Cadr_000030279 [Camelus dromedarius]|uniref:Uncharacterized protein n=1 Tax=Camelus dromedarius TaxID=9838 RepID=A0A5N4BZ66_CAMDR|nr:hypothetical protein Cadr_000030279 [Camelus dromedarius]